MAPPPPQPNARIAENPHTISQCPISASDFISFPHDPYLATTDVSCVHSFTSEPMDATVATGILNAHLDGLIESWLSPERSRALHSPARAITQRWRKGIAGIPGSDSHHPVHRASCQSTAEARGPVQWSWLIVDLQAQSSPNRAPITAKSDDTRDLLGSSRADDTGQRQDRGAHSRHRQIRRQDRIRETRSNNRIRETRSNKHSYSS